MKKASLMIAALLMFPVVSFGAQPPDPTPSAQTVQPSAQHEQTYRGQIMDSTCAHAGGHAVMGYKATHTHTPRACTLACNKAGSPLVLYNMKTKKIYNLTDQAKAKSFAGENVKIKGTLNKSTETIHVDSMKRA